MKEIFIGVIVGFISSFLTIYSQHCFSEKAAKRKEALNLLNEYYAAVFASYIVFLENKSMHNQAALVASIEKARIVAPEETEKLLEKFERKVLRHNSNSEFVDLVVSLRKAFRTDIQEAIALQESSKKKTLFQENELQKP